MNIHVPNIPRVNPDGSPIPCDAPGCAGYRLAQGLCNAHYQKLSLAKRPMKERKPRKDSSGVPIPCDDPGCSRNRYAGGLCNKHYQSQGKPPAYDTCPVPSCGRSKVVKAAICKKCNQFRWRFSLTPEQVLEFWRVEARVCSNQGCLSTENLHMDHDHACCPPEKFPQSHKVSCGFCVRGWLCRNCNLALGKLGDDVNRMRGLVDYLSRF